MEGKLEMFNMFSRQFQKILPLNGPVLYAGLPTGMNRKRFFFFRGKSDNDQYEAALISGLSECVREGDRVVVIGGGMGITAAFAALQAGPKGRVICFEGSKKCVRDIWKTLERNGVMETVDVRNLVVGPNIGVYHDDTPKESLKPEEVPDCDILEMDCEGSEIHILPKLRIRPRIILVESHGIAGASSQVVQQQLEKLGYTVELLGVAEPLQREFCILNDINVLKATRIEA